MPKSKSASKRAARRKTMPGFPWEGRFESIDEARRYLEGDRVQCLVCGQWKKTLGLHILTIHDLSVESYQQRYGIPYGLALSSSATSEKHSEIMKKSDRYAGLGELAAFARQQKKGGARPTVSTVSKQRQERIRSVNLTPHEMLRCHYCKRDMMANPHRVPVCPECVAKHRVTNMAWTADGEQRLRQWQHDNEERSAEYKRARAWWCLYRRPKPLIAYAEKWGAKLRIMPKLLEAVSKEAQ